MEYACILPRHPNNAKTHGRGGRNRHRAGVQRPWAVPRDIGADRHRRGSPRLFSVFALLLAGTMIVGCSGGDSLADRVGRLEREVASLRQDVSALRRGGESVPGAESSAATTAAAAAATPLAGPPAAPAARTSPSLVSPVPVAPVPVSPDRVSPATSPPTDGGTAGSITGRRAAALAATPAPDQASEPTARPMARPVAPEGEVRPDTASWAGFRERTYGLHLSSHRRLSEARDGWDALVRAYPWLLTGLAPRVRTVESPGDRAIFLRLLAGPFASRSSAANACRRIVDGGGHCTVVSFLGDPLI